MNLRDHKQAEEFVRSQMSEQPDRLAHVLVIARKVRETAEAIAAQNPGMDLDADLAHCAALLHDIGYAACARQTGFHPYDGYVFLKSRGFGDLAEIIVGHSCSPEEAQICGHTPIEASNDLTAKLLTYWDMQVRQGGEIVSYQERLSDIISRYGADSQIGRANLAAKPRIDLIFSEIEDLLMRN